jgi:two-component system cell cycle response regulator
LPLKGKKTLVSDPTQAVTTKRLKLLIADDSAFCRKLAEAALSAQEFYMFFATTGREAIETVIEQRPDLIITDWMMPDLTGVELCKRVREEFKEFYTYIILLTSMTDKRELAAGLAAGADDYLTKPFAPEELRARLGVGCRVIEFHRVIEAKARLLEELALSDPLTGLPNRRAIDTWVNTEVAAAIRHQFTLWAVMADLDQFKQLNDAFGHNAGDIVLKKFAAIVKNNCRRSNMCARIGGEEFLVVLTHTDLVGATIAIERIRESLAREVFKFGNHDVVVTASFGIARLKRGSETFIQLVSRADEALYCAKRLGRNRISIARLDEDARH